MVTRTRIPIIVFIVVGCILNYGRCDEAYTDFESDSGHRVMAKLVDVIDSPTGKIIVLEKENGKTVKVPLSILKASSQDKVQRLMAERRTGPTTVYRPSQLPSTPSQSPSAGLSIESLDRATVTLIGAWEEEDPVLNDPVNWIGTAFVTEVKKRFWGGSNLILVTNSHCLGLLDLAGADEGDTVEVAGYNLEVKFPSGATRVVSRMAEVPIEGLDLARLEVQANGLEEGTDYIVVPYESGIRYVLGDQVIAVGSPLGLDKTLTFGRISAIRGGNDWWGVNWIQHDAAINHGNSGGPLFLERNNKAYWIGVNTGGFSEGMYLSIAAGETKRGRYVWADASPSGAVKLLSSIYKFPAVVAQNAR